MPKLTKKEQQQYDQCLGQCSNCILKRDCELRVKIKGIDCVDIIVSGYEWICPNCEKHNQEIEINTIVTCRECFMAFQANSPEHALGK